MSQVTDIFTLLETVVSTALPTHQEHINPYFMEDESNLNIEKGRSVGYADGQNLQSLDGAGIELKARNFVVNITRRAYTLMDDQANRKVAEANLFNDQAAVLAAVAADEKIGDPCTVVRAIYTGDGGIEFIRDDQGRKDLLLISTIFEVQFQEG